MKITIIQDFLRSGGTERQTILLANAFAAAGHATTLLTFRPGGALAGTVSDAVTRKTLQPFDLRLDWFAPGLVATVRATAPDVVLCMGRMANCYAGTVQDRLRYGVVIATMRTGKLLPALFRRSLGRVRHIVANSRAARDTLVQQYRVPSEKISVIYNSLIFPDSAGVPPVLRDDLRARHGATPATTVLLCVAMFRWEKNQGTLIQTIAELPASTNWQLWLAGDGSLLPRCQTFARRLGLESRIRFLGFQRDPTPLYHAADIAVHASWSEALSNFLIEAQAHGLPVVAYDAQGIDECFIPNQTGWVIPQYDFAPFCAALTQLMADSPAERATRATAARAYARETFDGARNIQRYLDLFNRLIQP